MGVGLSSGLCLSGIRDVDFKNFVSLPNLIYYFKPLYHLAKASMVTVKVGGIATAVADKKLRPARIATSVRHGQYATVVVLIAAGEFARNFVTRAAPSGTLGATTLNHKVRNDSVKSKAIVKAFFR